MSENDAWIHRTEVKSETSNRVYVVSQHATRRFWGCSCPGRRAHRRCKHLTRLGLPGGEVPFEVAKDYARMKGFLDGYPTYDVGAGRGHTSEWRQAFMERLGLDEARQALGLTDDAGWDAICRALRLAATESMAGWSATMRQPCGRLTQQGWSRRELRR